MRRSEIKEGIHYALGDTYLVCLKEHFVCLKCHGSFPKQYTPKQRKRKQYGTKQLMALWAWHNFERHLESCWEKGN